ncbi:MAG: Zn-dependent hydrolase [Janthinobacterium lividum]
MSTNLPLSPTRLWDSLMAMGAVGGTAKGGCNRQTLTDEDGAGRRLLQQWGEAIGLTLEVDRVGTMRLHRPGRDPSRPAVAIGSHLDTQPTGGKFDGPLGVLAGLEILRALHEAGAQTEAPLVLVNWTNEEGARFSPPMMGSGTAMGLFTEADTLAKTDSAGASFGAELARIGWAGAADPAALQQLGAYFELHIEQGPTLERDGLQVGIVTHALTQAWFDVTVTGADSHGGGTMAGRRDALVAAAALVGAVEEIALAEGGRGTVGRLTVEPDSRNVVPGRVWFSVDMRAGDAPTIERMGEALRERAAALATARDVAVVVEPFWASPLTPFDPTLVGRLRDAAEARGLGHRDMPTGIGHDAVYLARRVPSAMLFVPCVDGISHNEAEAITPAWAAAGLQVLADAVLATAGLVR